MLVTSGLNVSTSASGGGTTNTITKFTGPYMIGDSSVTDDGVTVAITGAATVSTTLGVTGNATFTAKVLSSDGTAALPSIARSADATLGFFFESDRLNVSVAGVRRYLFNADSFQLRHDTDASFNLGDVNGNTGVGITRTAASTMALRSGSINVATLNATSFVVNEDGADIDFRIESDTNAFAFHSDAGLNGGIGAFSFGNAADQDYYLDINQPSFTVAANRDFYKFAVRNSDGIITVPAGTAALVASIYVQEPRLIATGTITVAASVYIADAPTEGTDNYGIACGANMNNDFGGGAILAQAATDGFIFIPRLDTGAPSGTPAAIAAGNVAICYDITNDTLEIYNGSSWRTIATV